MVDRLIFDFVISRSCGDGMLVIGFQSWGMTLPNGNTIGDIMLNLTEFPITRSFSLRNGVGKNAE
jgi:hypothetical protein